jgi:methylthioribose-1-phosphate isomerase
MLVNGRQYRTLWWEDGALKMIDQRLLPCRFRILSVNTLGGVCDAISDMAVRGAPAIGAAAAYGMAIAQLQGLGLKESYERLYNTRPTAYDLKDGLDHYMRAQGEPVEKAVEYANASSERCRMIGVHGAKLMREGLRVLTHCNAGALACVDWGTALSPMRVMKNEGRDLFVWVDETRPRLQGAKLTSWELKQEGIRHSLITDNSAGHLMQKGLVDMVLVGADRIAANGDVANKIGTYSLAVLARENNIPFYVAAPKTTFDRGCRSGGDIIIEERDALEVTHIAGGNRLEMQPITYDGCPARNWAFDITPRKYVRGVLTEEGII